jgi:hypothetical protein
MVSIVSRLGKDADRTTAVVLARAPGSRCLASLHVGSVTAMDRSGLVSAVT